MDSSQPIQTIAGIIISAFSRMVSVPKPIGWAGVSLGVVLIIGANMPSAIRPNPIQLTLYCLAVGTIVGVAVWQFTSKPRDKNIGSKTNALDQTIQIECFTAQVPKLIPPGGWFEIGSTMGMGVFEMNFPAETAGSENKSIGPDFPTQAMRCRITNYGPGPVLNVESDLTFNYLEIVKTENGMRTGGLIKSNLAKTPRINLGVGPEAFFDFYIRNYASKAYVEIILPKTVRVQAVGHDEWQTVNLIPPKLGGFGLSPFTAKEID